MVEFLKRENSFPYRFAKDFYSLVGDCSKPDFSPLWGPEWR